MQISFSWIVIILVVALLCGPLQSFIFRNTGKIAECLYRQFTYILIIFNNRLPHLENVCQMLEKDF